MNSTTQYVPIHPPDCLPTVQTTVLYISPIQKTDLYCQNPRALIMIFVTNPFGVGDWVRFGNDPVAVKVHELGLNFVVVATFWGELIFLPVSTC